MNLRAPFRTRKKRRTPYTKVPTGDPQQNATDANREMRPASGSRNTRKDEQATTSEISTAPVPPHNLSQALSVPDSTALHPLSASTSSTGPPLAHDNSTERLYRDVVSAAIRYVLLGFIPWTSSKRIAAQR
jgi:hypothetical protein